MAITELEKSQTDTVDVVDNVATDSYLQRLDSALDVAEQSIAAIDALQDVPNIGTGNVKKTKLSVSVVIPVYNERETILEIVSRVRQVGIHQEIVIVDDFSVDGTRDLLMSFEHEADVHVLMHGYNRGKGAALRTAFGHVTGDVVLIQDADLEYDPRDFPLLLGPLERGETDVVYGSRFLQNARQDPSPLHRFGNWLLTTFSNFATGQRLTDMETCYKAFRREALDAIQIEQNRFGFEPEITAKLSRLGHRIHEVPIRYQCRGYEEGKKIGIRDALNALACIVRYGLLKK